MTSALVVAAAVWLVVIPALVLALPSVLWRSREHRLARAQRLLAREHIVAVRPLPCVSGTRRQARRRGSTSRVCSVRAARS